MFLLSESCFAVILPGMRSGRAAMFAFEISNLLCVNFPDTLCRVNIAAYPENVKTIGEFAAAAPIGGR